MIHKYVSCEHIVNNIRDFVYTLFGCCTFHTFMHVHKYKPDRIDVRDSSIRTSKTLTCILRIPMQPMAKLLEMTTPDARTSREPGSSTNVWRVYGWVGEKKPSYLMSAQQIRAHITYSNVTTTQARAFVLCCVQKPRASPAFTVRARKIRYTHQPASPSCARVWLNDFGLHTNSSECKKNR